MEKIKDSHGQRRCRKEKEVVSRSETRRGKTIRQSTGKNAYLVQKTTGYYWLSVPYDTLVV